MFHICPHERLREHWVLFLCSTATVVCLLLQFAITLDVISCHDVPINTGDYYPQKIDQKSAVYNNLGSFHHIVQGHVTEWSNPAVNYSTVFHHRHRRSTSLRYPSNSVQIHINPGTDAPIPSGTSCQILCILDARPYPLPNVTFAILKQPFGSRQIRIWEEFKSETPAILDPRRKVLEHEFHITLEDRDNRVTLFCEIAISGETTQVARSSGRQINVTYPPRHLVVISDPNASVTESISKRFTCQLNQTGSNPPSELTWTQLDAAGAMVPMTNVKISPTIQLKGMFGTRVAQSNLTMTAQRINNGRRFECNAVYMGKRTMLRAEDIVEVKFPPNNVRLTAQPMDGVLESVPLELMCTTSSCHPPAVIRWFELPAHPTSTKLPSRDKSQVGNELTDLAQLDSNPGEFGGTEVSSRLTVRNTYRSHLGTIYRCQVEHPGMKQPIINEHQLHVLYPPSVKILTIPGEPAVGQTILISCQTSGGNPQSGLLYSWFGKTHSSKSSQSDLSQVKVTASPANYSPVSSDQHRQPSLDEMNRLSDFTDAQINLTQIQLEQRGWYACEVNGPGGSTHVFHYLDLNYPPRIDKRVKQIQYAHIGEIAHFHLFIHAKPPWAEGEWYQISNQEKPSPSSLSLGGGSLNHASFYTNYHSYHSLDGYDPWSLSRLHRSAKQTIRLKVGGIDRERRLHIVAGRGSDENGFNQNTTFTLTFNGVKQEDFGEYVCQVRHRLGIKEFSFHLIKKAEKDGILASSLSVKQRGSMTLIRFRPPEQEFYTRIVLRVCHRDRNPTHTVINPRSASSNTVTHSTDSGQSGCQDYHVANPASGETEVRLSDAVQLYNFRLIIYQGSRVVEETPQFSWTSQLSEQKMILGMPVVVPAVVGGCFLFLLVLVVIILTILCIRRRHGKKPERTTGMIPHIPNKPVNDMVINRSKISEDTEMHRLHVGGGGVETRSDIGSVRSYQPSEMEAIPLMHQMGASPTSMYNSSRIQSDTDRVSLFHNPTPSSIINNQIITEAYMAAARAASAAVTASVISGSTELYAPSTQLTEDMGSRADGTELGSRSGGISNMRNNGSRMMDLDSVRRRMRNYNEEHRSTSGSSDMWLMEDRSGYTHQKGGSRQSVTGGQRVWGEGGLSRASYTSLNSMGIEAAARAAACAAVASVMKSMNSSLILQHAGSSQHLNIPYAGRPSSRANSVFGPPTTNQGIRMGNESGDGESLHSAVIGSRYTPVPNNYNHEMTPTASVNHFEPIMGFNGNQRAYPNFPNQPRNDVYPPMRLQNAYRSPYRNSGAHRYDTNRNHQMPKETQQYMVPRVVNLRGSSNSLDPRQQTPYTSQQPMIMQQHNQQFFYAAMPHANHQQGGYPLVNQMMPAYPQRQPPPLPPPTHAMIVLNQPPKYPVSPFQHDGTYSINEEVNKKETVAQNNSTPTPTDVGGEKIYNDAGNLMQLNGLEQDNGECIDEVSTPKASRSNSKHWTLQPQDKVSQEQFHSLGESHNMSPTNVTSSHSPPAIPPTSPFPVAVNPTTDNHNPVHNITNGESVNGDDSYNRPGQYNKVPRLGVYSAMRQIKSNHDAGSSTNGVEHINQSTKSNESIPVQLKTNEKPIREDGIAVNTSLPNGIASM